MAYSGPIILIEDNPNDIDVIESAFKELKVPHQIISYTRAQDALDYLLVTKDQPYIILCDIRMPGLNGLEFRKAINDDPYLRKKSIPFIFLTGVVTQEIINEAYELQAQGFFQKANTFTELKDQLYSIAIYWKNCLHPNC